MDGVVDALVDRGLDVAFRLADADNLGDLPATTPAVVNINDAHKIMKQTYAM